MTSLDAVDPRPEARGDGGGVLGEGQAVIQGRLSRLEKVSYGAGEVASNLAWNMATGFLLLYYTDVALLPVAALGTLMLLTRVLDAVFDPLVGILVDRTRTRLGKARPYLLWGAGPFCLLTVATFTIPNWSPSAKLAYAYVSFTLLGLLYSLLYVPYSAMFSMITRDRTDRTQLASYRAMGTSIASIVAYGSVMPMVALFGRGDSQRGFTATAAVLGVASALLYLLVFTQCRERFSRPPSADGVKVGHSLRQIFHNPIWRVLFSLSLLVFVRIGLMVTSFVYVAKAILGAPGAVSVALPLMSVSILAGGFLSSTIISRIGMRAGNVLALASSGALVIAMAFFEGNLPMFVAIFALSNFVCGVQAASVFIISADAVEWQEARYGERSEGLLSSTVSFGMKAGMALGVAATAYTLGWAGYDPAQVTSVAAQALRWIFYGGQVALISAMIWIVFLYKPERHGADSVSLQKDSAIS